MLLDLNSVSQTLNSTLMQCDVGATRSHYAMNTSSSICLSGYSTADSSCGFEHSDFRGRAGSEDAARVKEVEG